MGRGVRRWCPGKEGRSPRDPQGGQEGVSRLPVYRAGLMKEALTGPGDLTMAASERKQQERCWLPHSCLLQEATQTNKPATACAESTDREQRDLRSPRGQAAEYLSLPGNGSLSLVLGDRDGPAPLLQLQAQPRVQRSAAAHSVSKQWPQVTLSP